MNRYRILRQLPDGSRRDVPFLDGDGLFLYRDDEADALALARLLGVRGDLIAVHVDESDRVVRAA